MNANALLTDLYQLTMLQSYFDRGMRQDAVFEFFVRRLPEQRNFLVAGGLEQAVDYLKGLRFTDEDIAALDGTELFSDAFLEELAGLRFTGHVDAMPEGTVFFANEPILRVVAPMPEAQFVESRLVNILHFQSLIASKAARCVLAADGKPLVDFGMRRAHGSEAAVLAARAAYLAGFSGTATVAAGTRFGIPIVGTMAHSYIQAHDTETEAFEHFIASHRGGVVLLIDTYDTENGARRVVDLARRLPDKQIRAVRLDSGDLDLLSRRVRAILDAGGCDGIQIFASGSIDEYRLQQLVGRGAPIDAFGIGTNLDVSADCPALDCVYKLQEYAGIPRRKRSSGKATWPGRKQVYRRYADNGQFSHALLTVLGDEQSGRPLLKPVVRDGELLESLPRLDDIRAHAGTELGRLPPALRALDRHTEFPVEVSAALEDMARRVDEQFQ